ncbi:hypothetical protein FE783_36930 [Paenibacillus mesophilus]|uniref:hypothetical protein n=1 Tax=Paenibacillus mesophilus TaxID=2582849 RepID=UPI00110E9792|nr:hypothetical protein [Paenibacillus mesophilus]TMV42800.1 hypothetical protein FE783_36930 [Paenibacillus mesophilus]
MFRRSVWGLGLFLALSLFFHQSVFAYGVYGPQPNADNDNEKYYYWGSAEEPQYSRNGVDVAVDGTSVSYQSIKATVTMDADLITDRNISYFAILANGVYVDFFVPYFDNALDFPRFREYYTLDIDISDSFIGSEIYFQVLGVRDTGGDQFVVAWSSQTANYTFKPLPVIDRSAISVLEAILLKLEDIRMLLQSLKDMLAGKLDQLTKAVEAIYTPSPEAEQRLNDSVENFMDKMPTKQVTDNMNQMQDSLQNSLDQMHEPGSKLVFGNETAPSTGNADVDSILSGMKLDLTEWKTYAELFRTIMAATLWVSFFHYFFNNLTPRLGI